MSRTYRPVSQTRIETEEVTSTLNRRLRRQLEAARLAMLPLDLSPTLHEIHFEPAPLFNAFDGSPEDVDHIDWDDFDFGRAENNYGPFDYAY